VYTTEKMISDNSDTIPEELKEEVEGKIVILKGAIEANNLPEMQTSMTDLNDALQRLGQAVYSQASDAGMPPDMNIEDVTAPDDTEVTTDPPSDDTIEGEFREVQ
ncbi:molecular chaperone DnaK, partial [Dehalococcoidia bacterium]|nr:molecular chaperone DnaK [Dehalococcoidia bacterium]